MQGRKSENGKNKVKVVKNSFRTWKCLSTAVCFLRGQGWVYRFCFIEEQTFVQHVGPKAISSL